MTSPFSSSRCLLLAAVTLISGQFATGQGVATYFNRNITAEAHTRIKNFAAAGHKIVCVAFPPAGGNRYSIVTDKTFYNRNVPSEMHTAMLNYLKAGARIKCVAFPPAGGNSFSIITDKGYYNRNIPSECHSKMGDFVKAGHKLEWVAFPPAGGNRWTILTNKGYFNRGVPTELHSKMGTYWKAGHIITCVAYPKAGGNRWTFLTNKGSFFNRGVPGECHRVMRAMTRVPGGPLQCVAYDPDGNGFSIVSKASPNGLPAVITYGSEVFSLDKFASNLKSAFAGKGVKYGFVVRYGGANRSYQWGLKRTAWTPPKQDFTIYDRFNPASVGKTVAGVAVLRALQNKGVSINEKIYKYLPSFWTIPSSVKTITFKELLNHRSGFRGKVGNTTFGYDYNGMRAMVKAGISLSNKVYDYENVNYALARIVCVYLDNYNESGVSNHSAKTCSHFISFVQKYVMDPCGAPSVQWKPDAVEPTLFFPNPAGTSQGTTYGDWSLKPGSAGVNISLAELSTMLDRMRNSTSIIGSAKRVEMDTHYLGWDGKSNVKNGYCLTKGGYFPGGPKSGGGTWNGGAELHAYIFKFSSGVQVSAVINGYIGVGGDIKTAYNNAWSPQFVSISSVTPSIYNVTANSLLVKGTNVHLTKTVYVGRAAITNRVYTDPTKAWFRVLSSSQLLVHLPQGMLPGTYAVKLGSGAMTSNSKNTNVTKAASPTLLVNPKPIAGRNYAAVASLGRVPASKLWLAVSDSNAPSIFRGIFNFGIGNNFQTLFFWPLAGQINPSTGATSFNLPSIASLKGQTFYFQALYATTTFPLPVSNVAGITFQ